jgi:hypothetical protein
VERAIGFGVDELSPASGLADVDVSVASGRFGKGAAGLDVALVFDVAEHLVNDTASLIALGYALRSSTRENIGSKSPAKPSAARRSPASGTRFGASGGRADATARDRAVDRRGSA